MANWLDNIRELVRADWQVQVGAAALVLTAGMALYSISWNVFDGYQLTQLSASQAKSGISQPKSAVGQELNTVLNAPVFGTYESEEIERVNTTLTLLGIMNSSDDEERRAFIAEPKKEVGVYVEGDEVSQGLKVSKILDDRVILSRFGTRETLYIDWDTLDGVGSTRTSSSKTSASAVSSGSVKRTAQERQDYLKTLRERFKAKRGNTTFDNSELNELRKDPERRDEYLQKIRERFRNGSGLMGRDYRQSLKRGNTN